MSIFVSEVQKPLKRSDGSTIYVNLGHQTEAPRLEINMTEIEGKLRDKNPVWEEDTWKYLKLS